MDVSRWERDAWAAAEWFRSQGGPSPRLAVVLGSGLGGLTSMSPPLMEARFEDIPGFATPSVAGHAGRLVAGRLHGVNLVVLEGRVHLYEGLGTSALRVVAAFLRAIGTRAVLLTSACGGLDRDLRTGDFVVVWDHLVYPLGGPAWPLGRLERGRTGRLGPNPPLSGGQGESVGPIALREWAGSRGPLYDGELSHALETACFHCGARWRRGVLALAAGPCYESAAEARSLRSVGADVVSMSAAADARAARLEGLAVACLCCVTNVLGLWRNVSATHRDVLDAARSSAETMSAVLDRFVFEAVRGGMGQIR